MLLFKVGFQQILEANKPSLTFQACHLLTLQLWESYCTSLSLSLLTFKFSYQNNDIYVPLEMMCVKATEAITRTWMVRSKS